MKTDYTGDNVCVYTSGNGDYADTSQKVIDVSDIYDCIEWANNDAAASINSIGGFSPNVDGICCMNRGSLFISDAYFSADTFSICLHTT